MRTIPTTDDSFRIASEFADQVQIVENRATRVGEIIERMSRLAQSRWVLRLDDDELPSVELMQYVGRAIKDRSVFAYAILRHQCIVSRSGELLRHRGYNDQIQWRLYQPDRMRYVTYGHTPGFKLPAARQHAPNQACMIHLDWAVHSYEQRLEKVQRYDAHTADHGSIFRKFYLREEDPDALSMLDPLPLPEFAQLSRDLRERFPKLCVDRKGPE